QRQLSPHACRPGAAGGPRRPCTDSLAAPLQPRAQSDRRAVGLLEALVAQQLLLRQRGIAGARDRRHLRGSQSTPPHDALAGLSFRYLLTKERLGRGDDSAAFRTAVFAGAEVVSAGGTVRDAIRKLGAVTRAEEQ